MTLATVEFERDGAFHRPKGKPLSGGPVVVVGGGPGLTKSALDAVKQTGVDFIAVNNSYLLFQEPVMVVALDKRWYTPEGFNHGHTAGLAGHLLVHAAQPNSQSPMVPHGVRLVHMRRPPSTETHREIIEEDPCFLCGKNSGHAAVHLAYHLGAGSVWLMGFDMGFLHGKSHWHGGHNVPTSESNYPTRFRPMFDRLIDELNARNVPVLSLTRTKSKAPMATVDDLKKMIRAHQNAKDGMDHPSA